MLCGYSELVIKRTTLMVPLMDINSDVLFGQIYNFKTCSALERSHLHCFTTPLDLSSSVLVHKYCNPTLAQPFFFTLCCVQLLLHHIFQWS